MNAPSWWSPARAGILAGMGFLAFATVIVFLVLTISFGLGRGAGLKDCPEHQIKACSDDAYNEERICIRDHGEHLEACAERLKLRLERCDQIFEGGTDESK